MKATIKAMVCTAGIAALSLTGSVTAQEQRDISRIYKECGLGAIVFGGTSENSQIFAAISNVTSDLGTTAISSGLLTPNSCSGGPLQTAAFIIDSYPSIERDLSRGDGEYINAMLEMRGCDASAHAGFVSDMRANYMGESVDGTAMGRASALFDSFENTLATGYADSCVI